MITTINRESLVKDLVIEIPQSEELFKQNHIDFYCGGECLLHEVIAEKQLDEPSILQALESLSQNTKNRMIKIKKIGQVLLMAN